MGWEVWLYGLDELDWMVGRLRTLVGDSATSFEFPLFYSRNISAALLLVSGCDRGWNGSGHVTRHNSPELFIALLGREQHKCGIVGCRQ